jgi:hypothetical protein
MKKVFLIALALLMVASVTLLAGSGDRLGTAGAQELRIPVGSRGVSLGGSMVASASGVDALFWNPAGAADLHGTEAMFSHLDYFADMNVEYVALCTNIEGIGTLGASVKVLSVGDILRTTWDDQQGISGETFNPTFSVVGLTFARRFTDRVSFGATAQFVNEKVEQVSAHGVAVDFGFTYTPYWRGLKFGVVVKNLGPQMKFEGSNFDVTVRPPDSDPNATTKQLSTENNAFELPSSVQFGVAWNVLNNSADLKNKFELSSTFQSNNFSQDEIKGGAEYSYNDMFFLRGGYVGSGQNDYMFGPSLGAGLKLRWSQTHISFDYTWQKTDFFTGDDQYFTVKLSF